MDKIRVNINSRELTASAEDTILKVALANGIEIPNLCYDNRLKTYGACGVCVVEIDGNPKLQRACSTLAVDGMIIRTETPRTLAARKVAFELMASDHRGDCRPPCVRACPANTDCQGYVGLIANGQHEEAIKLTKDVIALPASIGRICPHPCETECRRQNVESPVAIAELKRFLGDLDISMGTYVPDQKPPSGRRVAIVGAGPAGLNCAYFLARYGHEVIMFENQPYPGGMLRYGVPEYRLPKEILDAEINTLKKMGVKFRFNVKLGEDLSILYLNKAYDAVFVAIGAWESSNLGCEGQDMEGVLGGIEFLGKVTNSEPLNMGKKVIVVGGGNTAMDVARTAVRLGAERVQVIYRRTRKEMPAEEIEIIEAEEEGVEFTYLVAPLEIIGDGKRANAVRCQKMRLGEPDASGRRSPIPIPGEEVTFEADLILSAIGQQVNAKSIKELEVTNRGTIGVKPHTFETNLEGVFAGGEAATGPKIAITAIAQGNNAAKVIDSYLHGQIMPVPEPSFITQTDLTEQDFAHIAKQDRERASMACFIDEHQRKLSFSAVSETFSEEIAMKEAARCLECGCQDYFECKLIKYIGNYNINPTEIVGEVHKREEAQTHPFIVRNPDKCILCGQCIRACEEIVGATALGLEDRGFDSKVIPELNLPLEESCCVSCGQCIDVCPTGACMEIVPASKQVPVEFDNVNSVCNYCGVGCNIVLQAKGNLVFKSLPDRKQDEGVLCVNGRFGIGFINDQSRLKTSVVRRKGKCINVNLEEALTLTTKNLQLICGQYGNDSVGILASPRFTNGEAFMLKKIADKLGTVYVGTMAEKDISGTELVLGYNASSNSYDELYSTDLIISVGNITENNPVMGVKIKNAAQKRGKLVSLSNGQTKMAEYADLSLKLDDGLEFFKSLIKALFDGGYVNQANLETKAVNLTKLIDYVKDAPVSEEANKLAKMYGEAKKAIFVIDDSIVTADAIMLLADIAVITGKIGKPHSGIILMRSNCNSQGFIDMGVKVPGMQIIDQINAGKIKAVLIVGEDPAGTDPKLAEALQKLDFVVTLDTFETATTARSNIVIPIGSFAESRGSFTRSDRKIQTVNPAINPVNKYNVFSTLAKLGQHLGIKTASIKHVTEMLSFEVPEYSGLFLPKNPKIALYTPNSRLNPYGFQVLYTDGYNKEDKKAVLSIPEGNKMFTEKIVYDTVQKKFNQYLKENGLK